MHFLISTTVIFWSFVMLSIVLDLFVFAKFQTLKENLVLKNEQTIFYLVIMYNNNQKNQK